MRNVSYKSCRENQSLHFMDSNFSLTSCGFYEITGKIWYTQTGHRRQYGGMHTACWMTNKTHTHNLRVWNTYCFSTEGKFTLTRLYVTFMRALFVFSNVYSLTLRGWSNQEKDTDATGCTYKKSIQNFNRKNRKVKQGRLGTYCVCVCVHNMWRVRVTIIGVKINGAFYVYCEAICHCQK